MCRNFQQCGSTALLFAVRYRFPTTDLPTSRLADKFWLGKSLALSSFVDFSLPQQPFDAGYEFPDLLLVRAVVVTSDLDRKSVV